MYDDWIWPALTSVYLHSASVKWKQNTFTSQDSNEIKSLRNKENLP